MAQDAASDPRQFGARAVRRVSATSLTLTDAVGVSIARHPDVGRAEAVVAQSASELSVAKTAWFPDIQYNARPGYGSSFGDTGSSTGLIGTISGSQLIYDFGRTPSAIAAADATLARQRHVYDNTIEVTSFAVAQHYVDLSAAQATIAASSKQYESLRKTRDMIADRVKAGLSDASDLNHADISLQNATVNQLKAKTQFDLAAGELAEIIGIRPTSVTDLPGINALVSRLNGGDRNIERTPAILAAKSAVAAAEAKLAQAKAERYPSISFSASKSFSTGGKNTNDSAFYGLSLGGDFSLGNRAGYRVGSAEAERNAAMKEFENQQLLTRSALASADTQSSGALARTKAYDQVISLSRSSRDLYWQEYTLNKRPLTEMLNAEREVYSAEIERIGAEADGIIAKIKAQVATGTFVKRLRETDGRAR